jgi:hypothetical protein
MLQSDLSEKMEKILADDLPNKKARCGLFGAMLQLEQGEVQYAIETLESILVSLEDYGGDK